MTNRLFGCVRFTQLQPALRTGDVILYCDNTGNIATRRSLRLLDRAAALFRFLSYLPCVTHHEWVLDTAADRFGNGENTASFRDTNPAIFESDFTEKREAAFVIELVDETESNAEKDPNKLLAYAFVPAERLVVPLRDFVERMAQKEPRFSYRRLAVAGECERSSSPRALSIRIAIAQSLYTHCA
jgi:hypothetical protein